MSSGPIPLSALRPGYRGEVVAMVVRRWSIHLADDKYLGIDYVLADVCGNALHCSSRADVADTFSGALKVGSYVSFRYIDVRPNLKKYRVLAKPEYILQLTASTEARVLNDSPKNIRCPYFDLTPIEEIISDDKNTLVGQYEKKCLFACSYLPQKALRINEPNPVLETPRKTERVCDVQAGNDNEDESKRRKMKMVASLDNEDEEEDATSAELSCNQI